ncbi:uncharacterized protein EI90DRAFT_3017323 [Cantharellus anzutake]|uniref:uncharacterized protein n=1 Tax=Cantharellus anzutake TaxID=1750568 RepID=UPI001907B78C|nr:uncharacterized protein EI90DRAFT_3017323 [Cantharellus anzutake]KAF8329068.1 hypothetical protein EI90DRAFT_3017323 [Cantharellus anzutake]
MSSQGVAGSSSYCKEMKTAQKPVQELSPFAVVGETNTTSTNLSLIGSSNAPPDKLNLSGAMAGTDVPVAIAANLDKCHATACQEADESASSQGLSEALREIRADFSALRACIMQAVVFASQRTKALCQGVKLRFLSVWRDHSTPQSLWHRRGVQQLKIADGWWQWKKEEC